MIFMGIVLFFFLVIGTYVPRYHACNLLYKYPVLVAMVTSVYSLDPAHVGLPPPKHQLVRPHKHNNNNINNINIYFNNALYRYLMLIIINNININNYY